MDIQGYQLDNFQDYFLPIFRSAWYDPYILLDLNHLLDLEIVDVEVGSHLSHYQHNKIDLHQLIDHSHKKSGAYHLKNLRIKRYIF